MRTGRGVTWKASGTAAVALAVRFTSAALADGSGKMLLLLELGSSLPGGKPWKCQNMKLES